MSKAWRGSQAPERTKRGITDTALEKIRRLATEYTRQLHDSDARHKLDQAIDFCRDDAEYWRERDGDDWHQNIVVDVSDHFELAPGRVWAVLRPQRFESGGEVCITVLSNEERRRALESQRWRPSKSDAPVKRERARTSTPIATLGDVIQFDMTEPVMTSTPIPVEEPDEPEEDPDDVDCLVTVDKMGSPVRHYRCYLTTLGDKVAQLVKTGVEVNDMTVWQRLDVELAVEVKVEVKL